MSSPSQHAEQHEVVEAPLAERRQSGHERVSRRPPANAVALDQQVRRKILEPLALPTQPAAVRAAATEDEQRCVPREGGDDHTPSRTNASPPMYATLRRPFGAATSPIPARVATTGSAKTAAVVAAALAVRPDATRSPGDARAHEHAVLHRARGRSAAGHDAAGGVRRELRRADGEPAPRPDEIRCSVQQRDEGIASKNTASPSQAGRSRAARGQDEGRRGPWRRRYSDPAATSSRITLVTICRVTRASSVLAGERGARGGLREGVPELRPSDQAP